MIGLVIATHGELAAELLRTTMSIIGPVPQAKTFSISRTVDMDLLLQQLAEAVDEVNDSGEGVLIMTDMFGGTPANLAARFLSNPVVEIVNGINLPLLLKFCSSRESMPVHVLAEFLKKYGQKSIVNTRDILGEVKV
ncbi:MAG: PTS sugar transporter subunit IIA [Desulfuromonadaceae bacterium]|nr:PTS sugar transporter subunit IIA [Desulfuromonadaceae bacterium]